MTSPVTGANLRLRITVVAAALTAAGVLTTTSVLTVHRSASQGQTAPDPAAAAGVDWLALGAALTVVLLSAGALAWALAGRLLRPLTLIADTASRIAGRSLHQRLDLDLPPGDLRRLAEAFDTLLDRVDAALAGQSRFIANAAHELKTPLALHRTLVEVAMTRPGAQKSLAELGEKLLAVNDRQEHMINALLTLARADASIDRRPVNLAALAAAAVDGAEPLAENVRVHIDAALASAPTHGDRILLEQLLRNLLDNAIRYNVPGGRVWVRTRFLAADPAATGTRLPPATSNAAGLRGAARAAVTTLAFGAAVEVQVGNTGPGIAAEDVPELFAPFRRLPSRVGKPGSGLGLSIVRAVAQAHGGDAAAVPRSAGGLFVTVTLPAPPAVAGQAPPDNSTTVHGRRLPVTRP